VRRSRPEGPPPDADALALLAWHYEHPRAAALAHHRAGGRVIGVTSNTVPWELVRSAGAFPVVVAASYRKPGPAEAFVEPVFEHRIRSIVDDALRGDWSFLSLLITPRTSEWEHKLYLYLLEIRRQSHAKRQRMPVPYLYDLLHARSPHAAAHARSRTEQLQRDLQGVTGRPAGARLLQAAVRESNAARAQLRRLLALRQSARPRLSGTEALPLHGAWNFMDRTDHAALMKKVLPVLARRRPLRGPRILIKGAPLDHPGLHRAVERHGAVVIGEDDWWGSRSAGRDIPAASVAAIARKYYEDAPSPRVFPSSIADAWFVRAVGRGVEGVVCYLPPDDDVLGWDFPRHRRYLDDQGVPMTLIREDARHLTPAADEQLARFVGSLDERR
jgi:hypothetical protein